MPERELPALPAPQPKPPDKAEGEREARWEHDERDQMVGPRKSLRTVSSRQKRRANGSAGASRKVKPATS